MVINMENSKNQREMFEDLQNQIAALYYGVTEEKDRLKSESAALGDENARLQEKIIQLDTENMSLREEIAHLKQSVNTYDKCRHLQKELRVVKKNYDGLNTKWSSLLSFLNNVELTNKNQICQLMTEEMTEDEFNRRLTENVDKIKEEEVTLEQQVENRNAAIMNESRTSKELDKLKDLELNEALFYNQMADEVFKTSTVKYERGKRKSEELLAEIFGLHSPVRSVADSKRVEDIVMVPDTVLHKLHTSPQHVRRIIPETVTLTSPDMLYSTQIQNERTPERPSPTTQPSPSVGKSPVLTKRKRLFNNLPDNENLSPISDETVVDQPQVKLEKESEDVVGISPLRIVTNIVPSPAKGKFSSLGISCSPLADRRSRKRKILSPRQRRQLKKSNSLEVEITAGGIRKFKQTKLNLDCYKSQTKNNTGKQNVKELLELEEECVKHALELSLLTSQTDKEKDLILESPNSAASSVFGCLSLKMKKSMEQFPAPSTSAVNEVDPDETRLNFTLLNKLVKREVKNVVAPVLDFGLSYDRIPELEEEDKLKFAYKRDPVRKKADRMKLPGQDCAECRGYYQLVKMKESTSQVHNVVEKCSRHRDRNPLEYNTPEDFWKPYLTPSLTNS